MENSGDIETLAASTRVENRFYSIVRWFFLGVTTISIVISIVTAVVAIQRLTRTAGFWKYIR